MTGDDFEAELDHLATLCTHLAASLRVVRAHMALHPDEWAEGVRSTVTAALSAYEKASTP